MFKQIWRNLEKKRDYLFLKAVYKKNCNQLTNRYVRNFSLKSKESYYDVLQISSDATDEQVKSAYFSLSKKYHPDRDCNDPTLHKKFIAINKAYSVLSDPLSRQHYNFSLGIRSKDTSSRYRPGQTYQSMDIFGAAKSSSPFTDEPYNNKKRTKMHGYQKETSSNEKVPFQRQLIENVFSFLPIILMVNLFIIIFLVWMDRKAAQKRAYEHYKERHDYIIWCQNNNAELQVHDLSTNNEK